MGDVTYRVVVNDEKQYSIWPLTKENPPGWRDCDFSGLKEECLGYIEKVWTDMRPLSLQRKMDQQKNDEPKDESLQKLKSSLNQNPWLKYAKPKREARLRLFCLPPAGGAASFYKEWSGLFNETVEIFPVQLPGRENRLKEKCFRDIQDLMPSLKKVIKPYLTNCFAFFGHSLGASIAYELSVIISKEFSRIPACLIISASRAPHISKEDFNMDRYTDDELIDMLNKMEGIPSPLLEDKNTLKFFLPVIRADFKLYYTIQFRKREPLECPICVIGGDADNVVKEDQLEQWRDYTKENFSLNILKGNHFYILDHLENVTSIINEQLAPFL